MNFEYILSQVKENYDYALKIRRQIHQFPELSYQEFKTSEFIRQELTRLGIEHKALANTGTVALIGNGKKCLALRADIDALPIFEETGLDFSSKNNGVMHACGHDMHTAMLLTSAKILKENETELNGIVKLIFQPAEEKFPGGAIEMINEGVLENPKPEVIFGQHIFPGAYSGTISLASGPVFASTSELYWTIKGKSSHAAQPHLGNDAILTAAQLINYYQNIITKFKNPLESAVLSVTSIHGGTATNIFPEEIKMMGTLRTYNKELGQNIQNVILQNSKKIAELYNCECEIEIIQGYPPLINNEELTNFVKDIAINTVGEENTLQMEPKMWAEDFAYYAERIPACFWLLGVNTSQIDEMPPLHNSKLNPSENAMINGINMLIQATNNYLNNK